MTVYVKAEGFLLFSSHFSFLEASNCCCDSEFYPQQTSAGDSWEAVGAQGDGGDTEPPNMKQKTSFDNPNMQLR